MVDKLVNINEKRDKKEVGLFKKAHKYAKKNFPIFSALIVVIYTILMWVIRSFWYSYQIGEFSVYKIDKSYIDASSDNVILQLIQLLAAVAIWIFINYILYYIFVSVDKSRFQLKKMGKIALVIVGELFALVMIMVAQTYKSFSALAKALENSSGHSILLVVILLLMTCLTINIFAIQLMIMNYLDKRNEKKENNNKLPIPTRKKENIDKKIAVIIVAFIIIVSIEMGLTYYAGIQTANTRKDYKVIINEKKPRKYDTEKYTFKLDNIENPVGLLPVIYENQDIYIVSIFYKEDTELKINYNYQKVIEKDNIETHYLGDLDSLAQKLLP